MAERIICVYNIDLAREQHQQIYPPQKKGVKISARQVKALTEGPYVRAIDINEQGGDNVCFVSSFPQKLSDYGGSTINEVLRFEGNINGDELCNQIVTLVDKGIPNGDVTVLLYTSRAEDRVGR